MPACIFCVLILLTGWMLPPAALATEIIPTVNCKKGHSLADAIAQAPADQHVTIRFTGRCADRVHINRHSLTLIGVDYQVWIGSRYEATKSAILEPLVVDGLRRIQLKNFFLLSTLSIKNKSSVEVIDFSADRGIAVGGGSRLEGRSLGSGSYIRPALSVSGASTVHITQGARFKVRCCDAPVGLPTLRISGKSSVYLQANPDAYYPTVEGTEQKLPRIGNAIDVSYGSSLTVDGRIAGHVHVRGDSSIRLIGRFEHIGWAGLRYDFSIDGSYADLSGLLSYQRTGNLARIDATGGALIRVTSPFYFMINCAGNSARVGQPNSRRTIDCSIL